MCSHPLTIVILISGNGSNLQAIIDHITDKKISATIKAVISNVPSAYGLERARQHKISSITVDHKTYNDRDEFDKDLINTIDHYQPDFVLLAGFMRILTPQFVQHYADKLLNIHPSLLPKYPGLNTHQRAIEAGDKTHGTTIHFVTEELDNGPVVIQATVSIKENDSADQLKQKIQTMEHLIYPMVVEWLANKRLQLQQNKIYLDGELLPSNGYQISQRE